ncbi:hypothetical protein [Tenacibaculum sp. 190524A02b]|uniref:DUF3887 domain-containing protein n=1 Tax=Tenacibaculum vairaonense TaxID=3137860 RepID=A0ABM9PMX9_9FLAO
MKKNTLLFVFLLATLPLISFTYSENTLKSNKNEQSLEQKRKEKHNRVVTSLRDKNTTNLKDLLSEYQDFTLADTQKIIDDLNTYWGDLTSSVESTPVPIKKGALTNKVRIQFVASTEFGEWVYLNDNRNSDSTLRIGVLFEKNNDKVGALIISLIDKTR